MLCSYHKKIIKRVGDERYIYGIDCGNGLQVYNYLQIKLNMYSFLHINPAVIMVIGEG